MFPWSRASSLGVGVDMLIFVDWVISPAAERIRFDMSSWLLMSAASMPKGIARSFPFG